MIKARIGAISSGTMRTEDLIPIFLDTLRGLNPKEADRIQEMIPVGVNDDHEWWSSDDASLLLNEDLFDALQDYAPEYCYFGSLEGDGACYGFWPDLNLGEDIFDGDSVV